MKVIVIKKLNPFTEGSEIYKRAQWVLNAHNKTVADAKLEPSLKTAEPGARYQFERLGYFCVDLDSKPGALVFNRTVALKDTWARKQTK